MLSRHCAHVTCRRMLFKRLRKGPLKEEVDANHHEYSITPETFAFKVQDDLANLENPGTSFTLAESSGTDVAKEAAAGKNHPLQETRRHGQKPSNVMDFIYRNATNYPFQENKPQDVFDRYPSTTSARLSRSKNRPRKTKMLVSDFIEDSLYNPHYGYFSKEVEIFHNDKPFDYNNIDDVDQFMDSWKSAYLKYDQMDSNSAPDVSSFSKVTQSSPSKDCSPKSGSPSKESSITSSKIMPNLEKTEVARVSPISNTNALIPSPKPTDSRMARYAKSIRKQDVVAAGQFPRARKSLQLWHTPTELFSPYYGEALARFIIVNYKLNGCYPYKDLVIYEMGGGNGTLMCNILNYIKINEPDIYARTQYKIIEISSQLALKQFSSALNQKLISQRLDFRKLEIINKSIFNWDTTVEDPCFFIALEVFDNFAHDIVRYDATTGEPYQGHILIDHEGDFFQFYTPQLSHYTNAFLHMRENGNFPILPQVDSFYGRLKRINSLIPFAPNKHRIHPLLHSQTKLRWKDRLLPLKDNLTPGEFIPTRLLQFFHILKYRFPNHSLISSDFHSLPNTIPGYYNAPVVQTIINDRMVDVSTHMCHQGYFDIMFPTDFELACDMYKQCTGKLAKVESHRNFLYQWADVDMTTTKKGENPMLEFYKNVSFMIS